LRVNVVCLSDKRRDATKAILEALSFDVEKQIVQFTNCPTTYCRKKSCRIILSIFGTYNLPNQQIVELSNCWTVKLLDCQIAKLLNCRTVKLSNCQIDKLSNCWTVKLLNCQIVKLSTFSNLSVRQNVALATYLHICLTIHT
jgi:hypothetical protein